MKLPVSLLREYVETSLSAQEIGDLLTMAGFELEGLEEVEGEPVLEIKVMANRGDGLSEIGLAREMLAKDPEAKPTELYRRAVARFPLGDEGEAIAAEHRVSVAIETDACTRYACRLFLDVSNGDSPDWLQKRLNQAGMRPISLLVDLTNYVLLETGQPLHAFDFDKIGGQKIIVRQARPGERITTLNGVEHELIESDMVIADASEPVAVAGVMGGLSSEVGPDTRRMLLESAHFMNTSVRKTRKRLGLSTEASYRFERWVDPRGVVAALNRFRELYEQIVGQKGVVNGVTAVVRSELPAPVVQARVSRIERLLGMTVGAASVRRYLEALGFSVEAEGEPFQVKPPSWRPDVVREEDVAEEIGRVHGYDKIPERLPQGSTPQGGVFGVPALVDRVREIMLRCGLDQIISHSLRDESPLDFARNDLVRVRNPHSPEMAVLRNSLLPCLAEAARRNGGQNVGLFEIGRVFVQGEVQIGEAVELGILMSGVTDEPSRFGGGLAASFWSLKGVLDELAVRVGAQFKFETPTIPDPRFHPTRCAAVVGRRDRVILGIMGQIHPDVAERADLPAETFLAEIDLEALYAKKRSPNLYKPISRNPSVRRDIAILVDKAVPFEALESAVREACGPDLEKLWLFDVYEGTGVPEGSHSLAIAMQLRRMGENFTDESANQVRDQAVRALEALGAKQR